LVARSVAQPGAGQAEAAAKFAEIQAAAEGKHLGSYLANRYVRKRLLDVLALFPDHGSARLLLLQGGGTRPVAYATQVLAQELRRALQPIEWVARAKTMDLSDEGLGLAFDGCRGQLESLKGRVARSDEGMYTEVFELSQRVRTLSSLLGRARKAARQAGYETVATAEVEQEHKSLVAAYAATIARIRQLSGEVEEAGPEAAPKDPASE
jgi:hypothetical protein